MLNLQANLLASLSSIKIGHCEEMLVTVILLCCVYFVVASLLFHVWLYVCVYVPTCVLYRSGKEERPWPISGAKINNQSINQSSISTHT